MHISEKLTTFAYRKIKILLTIKFYNYDKPSNFKRGQKKHLNNFDNWKFETARDGNGMKFYPNDSIITGIELIKLIHISQINDLGFYISTEVNEDIPYFMIYNKID